MLDKVKIASSLDYASGATDRNGATVDTLGFAGVIFAVKLAAVATGGTNAIKLQHGDASNASDMADIKGSKVTVADDDDNQLFLLQVEKPTKRYVRVVMDKDATNACAESVVHMLHGPDYKPQVNDVTDAVTAKRIVNPISGTA